MLNMGLPPLIHPDILFGFYVENAITTLSSPEASLCREEAGEKEKQRAWGTKRKGEGEERPFPSSHRPPRAYHISIGIPSGSLWGGVSDYNNYPNW